MPRSDARPSRYPCITEDPSEDEEEAPAVPTVASRVGATAAAGEEQSWARPLPRAPSPLLGEPRASKAAAKTDAPADISGQGVSRGRKRYSWETFEPRIEVWTNVLMEFGVDLQARQSLFDLADHSRDGYESANDVVSKLLKKQADRAWPGNPSGFITRCALDARGRLPPRAW